MLAIALMAGCGKVVEHQVEQDMRRDLQTLVGPAQDYQVDIQGLSVASGTAQGATVIGTRIQLQDAPVVDRMELHLRDIQYDLARKTLQSVAGADAVARLRPDDVARFLEQGRRMRDVSLALSPPNAVTVRARPELSGVDLPPGLDLSVTGHLAGDGPRVRFEVDRVGAGGLSVGGAVADALSRQINPIVDLSRLPLAVNIRDVRTQDGVLTVSATGSYPR